METLHACGLDPLTDTPSVGVTIAGVIVGLVIGSTGLTLLTFFILASALQNVSLVAWIACYVVGVAVGVGGIFLMRRRAGFWSGFVLGAGIGLLGGTALCNVMVSGLGHE